VTVVVAFVAGFVFALGLGISGMTQPAKVLAFLDVAGAWDPSLALVMIGAIAVHAPVVRWTFRRPTPLLGARWQIPTRRDLDVPLVAGATMFGLGWGLSGYCPGPALVSLASGATGAVVFVAAMVAGMGVQRLVR
jgi:uncharacterized membrane protein YedE/YeeE